MLASVEVKQSNTMQRRTLAPPQFFYLIKSYVYDTHNTGVYDKLNNNDSYKTL